jgi:hypothetical protein
MANTNILNSLLDFTDIRHPKPTSHHLGEDTVESTENEAIIRSFKDLRERLKAVQK